MHVVWLHIQLQYFHFVLLLTQSIDLLPRVLCHFILHYPMPILGAEQDVVFALVFRTLVLLSNPSRTIRPACENPPQSTLLAESKRLGYNSRVHYGR